MHPRIEVEAAFTGFVRAFGGDVVKDLVGASPSFLNADYLFREAAVVAELKTMIENKAEDLTIRQKINGLFRRWTDEKLVPAAYGTVQVQSRSLPTKCQRELLEVFAKPLRKQILKANCQIKETLKKLDVRNGKGLIILVNDGNYALEADASLHVVGRILGEYCHCVNSVVYMTVNMLAESPLTSRPVLTWVHAARLHVPAVDYNFVDCLFEGWRAHLGCLRGQPIDVVPLTTRDSVAQIKHRRGFLTSRDQ